MLHTNGFRGEEGKTSQEDAGLQGHSAFGFGMGITLRTDQLNNVWIPLWVWFL